jgi:hypothetical protein
MWWGRASRELWGLSEYVSSLQHVLAALCSGFVCMPAADAARASGLGLCGFEQMSLKAEHRAFVNSIGLQETQSIHEADIRWTLLLSRASAANSFLSCHCRAFKSVTVSYITQRLINELGARVQCLSADVSSSGRRGCSLGCCSADASS